MFQAALAWTGSHLWETTFGRTGCGMADPKYGFGGPIDARNITLAQAFRDTGRKTLQYLYDFGDVRERSVKIEAAQPADPLLTYPRILEAIGERPREDSGGPYGYAGILEALDYAEHEYHEEALENLGEEYAPNRPPNITFIEAKLAALAKNGHRSRGQHAETAA